MSAHTPGPLDINATIVGLVVELRYPSHGEAVRQLHLLRERLAQRDELLMALQGLLNLFEQHEARAHTTSPVGDYARAAIAKATGSTHV